MPPTRRDRRHVRFCLDANISYRVADQIDPDIADIVHISQIPLHASSTRGRSSAPDTDVAAWCASNERVLITCDDDFRARTPRTQALAGSGLEVIVFTHELLLLTVQTATIKARLPAWQARLSRLPYGSRVWLQYRTGALCLDSQHSEPGSDSGPA